MAGKRYSAEKLHQFCLNVFGAAGLNEEDAEIAAHSLVRAELEGAPSHGISRLPIYTARLQEGRINARPRITYMEKGALLKADGDNGLGQVVASRALHQAVPLARKHGIAGVFIHNSNHFGTAAFYCQQACEEAMAIIATTNSPPGIAPWGGKHAFLGTNPIAFGFPVKGEPPVIIDMSSSVAARGNIILAAKQGEKIPLGWAINAAGEDTDDPHEALQGAVLPFGGAKGYAIALAVEVFSSVLSGAAFGPHVHNLYNEDEPPANVGHSFILIDIDRLVGLDVYYRRLGQLLQEMKQVPRASDERDILYPGERRFRTFQRNSAQGIALSDQVVHELKALGRAAGVSFL